MAILVNEITKIRDLSHFDRNHIAIYCPPDEHMNFKETKVLVHWRGEFPTPLTEFEAWDKWEGLIVREVKALEEKYKALWNMHIFVHPDFKEYIYAIEKCCERVLEVKNDPLLKRSFEESGDYRDYSEYATMFSRYETEVAFTAKRLASWRDLPKEDEKEEKLKEAIRQVTLAELEEEKETKDKDLRTKKINKK